MRNPLKRKQSAYEKQLTPKSLNADPMIKEGQLGAVIALPLLAFLFGIIFYAKNYAISQEEFSLFSIVGLIVWMVGLVGYYGYCKGQAAEHKLFDREFGFDERLHPRREVYCRPEDIRLILQPKDTVKNIEDLKTEIESLGFDVKMNEALFKALGDMEHQPAKYLYYFKHKDSFEGWNVQEHTRLNYRSHLVFTDEIFDDQFVFAAGQENWWGPILYNHPSGESDNVKVLGWTLDPFTNDPMPITHLIHSSKRYMMPERKEEEGEYKELDAKNRVIAMLHGIIRALRKENEQVNELKDTNFAGQRKLADLADDASDVNIRLWLIGMKAVSPGLLRNKIFQGLVTIVSIIAVVFIIIYVLNWLQYIHVWAVLRACVRLKS